MKIAVDLSFVKPDHTNGGTESVIKNLINGWRDLGLIKDFIFFIHKDIYIEYGTFFPECIFKVYDLKGSHKVRTLYFQTFMLPKWIKEYQADLLFYPTYVTGYHGRLPIPIVVTPHDIQFKFYPQNFSIVKRCYLHLGYSHALQMADRIVAISDYVKETLQQHYKKQCGDKIITICNPIHFHIDQSTAQHEEHVINGIRTPVILSVSSVAKHKNMITLVKAYERISSKIPYQLVVVGCKGDAMCSINEYMISHELTNRVIFTDYVNDDQLNWLYSHALQYITTSLYEGFGMTPVEAIGRGIPTLSSTSTSLREVTLDLAEYYEPAEDDLELSEKILEMIAKIENPSSGIMDEYQKKGKVVRQKYREDTIGAQYYHLFINLERRAICRGQKGQ